MRRAAKVDNNQACIVAAFRGMGASVRHTHMIGEGFPDIAVGYANKTVLVEIKDGSLPPSKRKLTPDEKHFHDLWRGAVAIVETTDDVIELMAIMAGRDT
jgi:hypothetical protein